MATKLARRIVESNSPTAITEAFLSAMQERVTSLVEGIKVDKAHNILFEGAGDYDDKLDEAVNFIMEQIEISGVEKLGEQIEKASALYSVRHNDLVDVFEDAIMEEVVNEDPEIQLEQFQKSVLKDIDNIIESQNGAIIGFANKTSTFVTPFEGLALLEVYSNLNDSNKKIMVEKLTSSKTEFTKLVDFASSIQGGLEG